MRMSDEIAQLATALSAAQGEIDDAQKGSINPAYRSKYADLAAVRAAIKAPLQKHGLSIVQLPRTVQGGVEVETMLLHKSGEFIAETLFMPVGKFDAHGIGSGISYSRRYGIMSVLALASDDDDGNASVSNKPVDNLPVKNQPLTKELMQKGRVAAKNGALQEWWKGLSKSDRDQLSVEDRTELKKLAEESNGTAE